MSDGASTSSSISLRSVALVAGASLGQMLLLLGLQRAQARAYGASPEMDAFLCAYALPLMLGGILGAAAGTAIVPFYNQVRQDHGEAAANAAALRLGVTLIFVSGLLASVLFAWPSTLAAFVFRDLPISGVQTTARLLRVLCWVCPLTTTTGYLYGLFHARQQFLRPAVSGLIGPAVTLGMLAASPDPTIDGMAWAIVLGGVAGIVALLPWRAASASRYGTVGPVGYARFAALAFPMLLGAAYAQMSVIVDRILAQSLTPGSISHLAFAWRMVLAVSMLATSGLSVVIFPALARHAAGGDLRQMRGDLAEAWRFIVVVMVPVVAGILACGRPILAAFLEVGQFRPEDTAAVDLLVKLLLGYLVAAAFSEVAARALTALGRVWFVSTAGMLGFTLASLAKVLVVRHSGAAGLSAVMSVMGLVVSVVLVATLTKVTGRTASLRLAMTLLRSSLAAAIGVGAARSWMSTPAISHVLGGVLIAAVLYSLLLLLLQDEFALRAWKALPFHKNHGHPPGPQSSEI